MKEKRILAVFITSVITLVTSLAVTFGILPTLADPVVATGLTKYTYVFNASDEDDTSLIQENGNVLSLKEEIFFRPTKSVTWGDNDVVIFSGKTMEDKIYYANESVSSKIKIIPLKVKNNYSTSDIEISLRVNYGNEGDEILNQFTFVKIYDFASGEFHDLNGSFNFTLKPTEVNEYAVIVYANEEGNRYETSINWKTSYENINVVLVNNTENPV